MFQTPKMIAVKVVKWIITWKNKFWWPCEGCKISCRFCSFPPISSRTEWCQINTAWLPSTVQNGGRRSRFCQDKFLQDRIAGTSEAETSVSKKAECLLAIGEDKKSKFFQSINQSINQSIYWTWSVRLAKKLVYRYATKKKTEKTKL